MKIVVSEFMSLDGVVQAPGGKEEDLDGGFHHGGWSMPYFDPEKMGAAIGAAMASTDAMLFGRRTYATMAAAWGSMTDDPFADAMNATPKYVLSRTYGQEDLTWGNSTLLSPTDPIAAVRELKAGPGRDVAVVGSSSVARLLAEHDLVDEYRLMIEPILLGGGKRIFVEDGVVRPLELVSTEVASTGVLICTYRPATDGGAA